MKSKNKPENPTIESLLETEENEGTTMEFPHFPFEDSIL